MDKQEMAALADVWLKNTDRLGFKLSGLFARIFGSLAAKDEEVYWYAHTSTDGDGFVNLAAVIGDTAQSNIRISQEADFIADRIMYVSLITATGVIQPRDTATGSSFTLRLRDGGSDRQLMNFECHSECVAGSAQRTVPFPKRRLFRRNSTITIDFTNRQAVASQVWLAMLGYKIYDEASLDLVRRR